MTNLTTKNTKRTKRGTGLAQVQCNHAGWCRVAAYCVHGRPHPVGSHFGCQEPIQCYDIRPYVRGGARVFCVPLAQEKTA